MYLLFEKWRVSIDMLVFQGVQPSSSTSWLGAPNSSASGSAKIHTDEDLPPENSPSQRTNGRSKWCQTKMARLFFAKSFIFWNGCIQRLHDWKLSWHDDSTTGIGGVDAVNVVYCRVHLYFNCLFGGDVTFLPSCKDGQHRLSNNWQLWRPYRYRMPRGHCTKLELW